MRHIELHILQSFPVSCLNRDDLNSPKTAIFGGVQRARVSSQCWKRAIRESMQENDTSGLFKGQRGRWIIQEFENKLKELKEKDEVVKALAICVSHYLAKIDSKNPQRVKTLLYLSPLELGSISRKLTEINSIEKEALVNAVSKVNLTEIDKEDEESDEDEKEEEAQNKKTKMPKSERVTAKQFTKLVDKSIKPIFKALFNKEGEKGLPKDASDIAIFGRMVANDASVNKEGSAAFNHALSVHKVDNEIDFFSGMDELQPRDETGAGMAGTLEFNSAMYYRFAALNLDMLFDKDHLACLDSEERKKVVNAFVKATLQSIPMARRNSMNGNVLPNYVLCVIREKGHPIQLINAFEKPIISKNGIIEGSIEALKNEYEKLKTTWGIEAKSEIRIPEKSLKELLSEVEKYVPAK